MENDLDATVIQYLKFFEKLTDESVEDFRKFASPRVRYCGPMIDAGGVDAALAHMHKWFKNLDGIKFDIKGYARDGQLVKSHWRMTFRMKKLPKKLWDWTEYRKPFSMMRVKLNINTTIGMSLHCWNTSRFWTRL